jgi:DNA-binding MarR family transcriptional regulator
MMQDADLFTITLRKWISVFMHRSMQNFISFAKENGLSMSQVGALFHIFRGNSSVSEVGDGLGVTNAAASQLLERLVKLGLITRTENPNDRRVKQIVLTEKGQEFIQGSIAVRHGWMDYLSASLTDMEKVQIVEALNILIDKTNQLEALSETVC